jgi:hypothetical protein
VGWQPSRFLTDRAEAERAFALAEQLGSVNAAAQQLGTTWPSLRKAFTRHGLGMPARNPEAGRQRTIAAANQRGGPLVAPPLDPVSVPLNRGQLGDASRCDRRAVPWRAGRPADLSGKAVAGVPEEGAVDSTDPHGRHRPGAPPALPREHADRV